MLLTEFNQVQYEKTMREEGREEGRKEGRQKGENRLSSLVLSLMKEGRMNDLERAMKDNDFRAQLFQSHNL